MMMVNLNQLISMYFWRPIGLLQPHMKSWNYCWLVMMHSLTIRRAKLVNNTAKHSYRHYMSGLMHIQATGSLRQVIHYLRGCWTSRIDDFPAPSWNSRPGIDSTDSNAKIKSVYKYFFFFFKSFNYYYYFFLRSLFYLTPC